MDYQVKIQKHSIVYQGFFRLESYQLQHQLFQGGWSRTIVRELLERGHAVAVLLYDPVLQSVVMVEQFRIGAFVKGQSNPQACQQAWLLELVAGVIEEGESKESVAMRETLEESGCEIQSLIPICDYYVSPGGASEKMSLFCGRVDASQAGGIYGLEHEGEDIRGHVLSLAQAKQELYQGRINSASAIIALQWLFLHKGEVDKQWQVS